MKLLQRTGRYYLLFSTLVFILWGAGLFLALRFVLYHETDERLKDARRALHIQLSELDSLPATINLLDRVIEISPAAEAGSAEFFTDTLIWSRMEEDHPLSFRKYQYYDTLKGRAYRISINHSLMDTEEMLTTIILTVFGILGLLLLTINLFNRFLSLRLWKPFYQTIRQIKGFSFDRNEPLVPPPTNVDEFATLHQAIRQMTSKAMSDYQSLKSFTENASHEIQNPLAIIKSEVERLNQLEGRNEKESQALQQIQNAASRLSKLNHSLLLLTRIENRQYSNTQSMNIKKLVEDQLELAEALLSAKKLDVQTDMRDVFKSMNPSLAEVMVSNLIGNAIKHNLPDGHLAIELDEQKLSISNSGEALQVPAHQLFERFHKGKHAAPSLGLGLAIVKEICACYQFDVQYHYDKHIHTLTVFF